MSDLGKAVERMLTGSAGAPTFGETLRAYVADAGSGRAAARALGVSASTVRRWLAGGSPSAAYADRFDRAARAMRSRTITNDQVLIRTRERDSRGRGGTRDRELRAKNLGLSEGAAERVRDAYVAGGAEAAAKRLVEETNTRFYRTMLAGSLDPDTDDVMVSEYGAAVMA